MRRSLLLLHTKEETEKDRKTLYLIFLRFHGKSRREIQQTHSMQTFICKKSPFPRMIPASEQQSSRYNLPHFPWHNTITPFSPSCIDIQKNAVFGTSYSSFFLNLFYLYYTFQLNFSFFFIFFSLINLFNPKDEREYQSLICAQSPASLDNFFSR